jgi:TM2 domain-containing membrane protein YozV
MTSETSARGASAGDLSTRIDAMYARDRLWAWAFVVALWLVVAFVLLSSIPYASGSVTVVCWIAAIVLLIFNTGSIANMVRHYGHDKERIYGTDIKHLDAGR